MGIGGNRSCVGHVLVLTGPSLWVTVVFEADFLFRHNADLFCLCLGATQDGAQGLNWALYSGSLLVGVRCRGRNQGWLHTRQISAFAPVLTLRTPDHSEH